MKTLIACICLLIGTKISVAQNAKIDSLNRLISMAKTDTQRINLVNNKIKILSRLNFDSAIALGKKTLEEIKKINYYEGEIITRQKLIANYCFKGDYQSALEHLKFLEHFIKPSKDSSDLANVYANYGMMYGMQSKYDSSIRFYEIAIGIHERRKSKNLLSGDYTNIAIAYQQLANFPLALAYLHKGLKISEELNDEVQLAYTFINIGNTYDMSGDPVRAESAYLDAIALAKKASLNDVELYAYTNISTLYIRKNNWQKGYEFGMKAATLGGAMGDQGIQAASLSKAALSLGNLNKFSEAMELSRQAIAIADSSNQPLNINQANASMGSILHLQKKYKEAITFFEKSILATKDSDLYDDSEADLYKELSDCYEQTGNYSKALSSYKKATAIGDSVRSKDNIRKSTELSMNYEFDKKQSLATAIQDKTNAEARLKQLLLLGGLVLTLVLAAGGWISFRNKQKANLLLQQQKEEVEKTLAQLKNTQVQLIQSEKMASLGELTAGIAHEIQNPLNFVNNFSEINTELIAEMEVDIFKGNINEVKATARDISDNEKKINHHGKRADAIVKGMLQHSRTSGSKELTNINTLSDEYLRLAYHGLRAKDKSFNTIMKTDLDARLGNINIIPQDIGRVILNLITNAFYAVSEKKKNPPSLKEGAEYEPTVLISTKLLNTSAKDGHKVLIAVRDNGNGIPQKILDKVFQPFFTTKPTGKGTGLGLSLSYDIIKAHGGDIKVETKEGEFAEFIITLPA